MAFAVFDNTFLALLTDGRAPAPPPPAGVSDTARDRLNYLLEALDSERSSIIIPTPVLTEALSLGKVDFDAALNILKGLARVRIEGFGERAAIECALMLRKTGRGDGPKSKVKFDHQLVAIARVLHADVVYSDDGDVRTLCGREGLGCRGVWDLPARPVDPQRSLDLRGS